MPKKNWSFFALLFVIAILIIACTSNSEHYDEYELERDVEGRFCNSTYVLCEQSSKKDLEGYVFTFFDIPQNENILSLEAYFIRGRNYNILFAKLLIPEDSRDEVFVNYSRSMRFQAEEDPWAKGEYIGGWIPSLIWNEMSPDDEVDYFFDYLGSVGLYRGIGTVAEAQLRYVVVMQEREGTVLVYLYGRHAYWEPHRYKQDSITNISDSLNISEHSEEMDIEEYVSSFFGILLNDNITSVDAEFINIIDDGVNYNVLFVELLVPSEIKDEVFVNYLSSIRRREEMGIEINIVDLPFIIRDRLVSEDEIDDVHMYHGPASGTVVETQNRYIVFTQEREGYIRVLLYASPSFPHSHSYRKWGE